MPSDSYKNKYYDRSLRVSQGTIDKMKEMGMSKAIEHARSGSADKEFVEAAKRFYGRRVSDGNPSPGGSSSASTNNGGGGGGNTQTRGAPAKPDVNPSTNPNAQGPPKTPPPQAAIERKIRGLEQPEGKDINRAEYAKRLADAKKHTGRAGAVKMNDLIKQATKDRETRAGRPQKIKDLESQIARIKEQGGRATIHIPKKQKELEETKRKHEASLG